MWMNKICIISGIFSFNILLRKQWMRQTRPEKKRLTKNLMIFYFKKTISENQYKGANCSGYQSFLGFNNKKILQQLDFQVAHSIKI